MAERKPRLVIPDRFRAFWPKRAKKPETDWDDKPGKPRLVIPVRFRVFWPKRPQKTRTGLGCHPWEAQACHPSPFWGFLAEKGQITPKRTGRGFLAERGQKNPKRTGLTTLGSPGSSSQSVLGFSGRKRPKKPKTDWDDKSGKPRFVIIPVRFAVFWSKGAKTQKWTGMQPWETQACYPSPFWAFLAEKGTQKPKWIGMTTLESPGLSSQSVLGFSGRKGPRKPETDWDDNSRKPRLVIPVRFRVFWPTRARKH